MKRMIFALAATLTLAASAAAQEDEVALGVNYHNISCNADGTYTCGKGCPQGFCC